MKKNIIHLFLTFCVLGKMYPQNGFNYKYDFTYPAAIIQGIVQNGDSIIVSGFVGDSFPPYPNRSFIGVANQQGGIQYFHILDTTNKNYQIYPASLTKSKYGKYYFASGICFDMYTANLGYIRSFFWKLDKNLDTIYTKQYNPNILTDGLTMDNSLEYNKDTMFLLCSVWKYNNQGNFYDDDLVVILTDSLGNEHTRKHFIDNTYRHLGWSVEKCNAGILAASGKIRQFHDNVSGQWKYEFCPNVLLFNSKGDIIKSYNTPSLDYRSSLWATATQDGSYVFCGAKLYTIHYPNSAPDQTDVLSKGYIEKLDANFNKVWGRYFGDSTYISSFSKIIEAKNGDYIAVGRDLSVYQTVGIDTIIVDSAAETGWVIRVSPSGNKIWERWHKIVYGNSTSNWLGDIYEQADGSLVMSGLAYDDVPSPITTYGWLIKTDSFGCLVPGCQTVGIAENTPLENSFKLYPNPASDRLFLYYNNPQLQNCVFSISDLAGRQLVPCTPLENSTTYEMRIGDWAKGLYFVEVRDEKGNVHTEKFVKE